ncbi:MAG: hypothetical protein RLZZ44_386, partial [Bacteroidota bacterium]
IPRFVSFKVFYQSGILKEELEGSNNEH